MTTAAIIADAGIDMDLAVNELDGFHGAGKFRRTLLAAVTLFIVRRKNTLPDDAEIVEVRLDAVVGTAPYCDLKLVRQGDTTVTLIKFLMDFLTQREGVDQSELAGRSLAGNNGAYFGTRSARFQSSFP